EIAELPRLLRHGVGDVGVRVAEVGDVGAADGVEIALAAVVDEPAPLAAHDAGEGTPQLAVENVSIGIPVSRHPSLRSLRLREMLVGTRFGDAQQLHRVRLPGGARTQLTFFADPVSGASYQPGDGRYIVLSKDVGGGEFFQKYRYDVATGDVALLTDGKSRNV